MRLFEVSDPEDVDVALKVCREVFSEVALARADRWARSRAAEVIDSL